MSLLRPDLADLPAYQRPAESRTGLRLHMNEAPADWSEASREALLARLRYLPFHQYPERQGELSERLRKRLGAPEGGLLLDDLVYPAVLHALLNFLLGIPFFCH